MRSCIERGADSLDVVTHGCCGIDLHHQHRLDGLSCVCAQYGLNCIQITRAEGIYWQCLHLKSDGGSHVAPAARKTYAVAQDEKDRKNFASKWDKLNGKLKSSQPSFQEPDIPFRASSCIRDYNTLYHKIYDKEKFINL